MESLGASLPCFPDTMRHKGKGCIICSLGVIVTNHKKLRGAKIQESHKQQLYNRLVFSIFKERHKGQETLFQRPQQQLTTRNNAITGHGSPVFSMKANLPTTRSTHSGQAMINSKNPHFHRAKEMSHNLLVA